LPIGKLCRQQRPYSLLTACHVGCRQRIYANWYAGGRRRLRRQPWFWLSAKD
jgi:hypothetical protein